MRLRLLVAVAAMAGMASAGAQTPGPKPAQSQPQIVVSGAQTPGGLLILRVPRGTTRLLADGVEVPPAPDGRYLVGLGRDSKGPLRLEAMAGTRVISTQSLAIEPRQWRIQRLPALGTTDTPDPEWVKRRAAEKVQLDAAKAVAARSQAEAFGWSQAFVRPAAGRITGVYGSQRVFGGLARAPHTGLDIANATGTPVRAPAEGIVRFSGGPFLLEGNIVLLDHGAGVVTSYMHLSERGVKAGDRVTQGQYLGRIGTTGRSTGPHLHWGLSLVRAEGLETGEVRLDPRLRLGGG